MFQQQVLKQALSGTFGDLVIIGVQLWDFELKGCN